ncbi:hypothetical protein ACNI65_25535 [Roseateles sp. So40a]|uniref:hypothetical protein n=1 Tax=Roseateles sp. So40a TaxID=3400226 RepID=UPI003A8995DE
MDMTVNAAQADMRRGYYSGATGILASAIELVFAALAILQHRRWARPDGASDLTAIQGAA